MRLQLTCKHILATRYIFSELKVQKDVKQPK